MRKLILSLLLFSLTTACGDSDSKSSKKNNGGGAVQDLDISDCVGTDEETIEGLWTSTSKDGGVRFDSSYYFENGAVQLSVTCDIAELGLELTAQTSSTYQADNASIQFLYSNSATETYDDGSTKADCTASISAMTLNYELKGQCLVFSAGNEQLILTRPSN